jgi:adenylate cyclase
MAQVAERLSQTDALLGVATESLVIEKLTRQAPVAIDKAPAGLSLSLDNLSHPAYMLNYNLELTWLNEPARRDLFGFEAPPARSDQRNLLQLLARTEARLSLADQRTLSSLHLRILSSRITRDALTKVVMAADPELLPLLDELEANPLSGGTKDQTIAETDIVRKDREGNAVYYRVYAVYFREGILVVHEPDGDRADDLLRFLGRRDQVIQSLLSKRLPVMTPLAVLVADLQNSIRICSELPPDEYFELINQIWSTMGPILRKYVGTHGKHVGDGVVYYFFPQPESNYLFNSIACANELRAAM